MSASPAPWHQPPCESGYHHLGRYGTTSTPVTRRSRCTVCSWLNGRHEVSGGQRQRASTPWLVQERKGVPVLASSDAVRVPRAYLPGRYQVVPRAQEAKPQLLAPAGQRSERAARSQHPANRNRKPKVHCVTTPARCPNPNPTLSICQTACRLASRESPSSMSPPYQLAFAQLTTDFSKMSNRGFRKPYQCLRSSPGKQLAPARNARRSQPPNSKMSSLRALNQ